MMMRDCLQEHFTATYKENVTEDKYQKRRMDSIREDIKDL